MNLKPESLGKLTLRISTENGVVMAKFAAESQQVKEIIEANMQTLKDSLEKQGINIQGLSVSVGHGNKREQNSQSSQDSSQKKAAKAGKILMSRIGTVGQFAANRHDSINPYTVGHNQINITA